MSHRREIIINLSIYKSNFSLLPVDIVIYILDFIHKKYVYTYVLYNSLDIYYDRSDYFFVTCVEFSRYDLLNKYLPNKHNSTDERSLLTNLYVIASCYGNINMIKYLENKKVGYLNTYCTNASVYFGHLDILKLLISYGCPVSKDTYFYALSSRQYHICKYLLNRTVKVVYMVIPYELNEYSDLRNIFDSIVML